MIEARIPKDIAKVKQKIILNLTWRQMICFGSGALAGVPLYFILKTVISPSAASLVMVLVMLPFMAFGIYEKNGEPLEVVIRHFVRFQFLRPKRRPYQTENDYALLEKQAKLNKEVMAIVRKEKKKAHSGGKKADS